MAQEEVRSNRQQSDSTTRKKSNKPVKKTSILMKEREKNKETKALIQSKY